MHAQIISLFNSSRNRTEFKGHTLQNVSLSPSLSLSLSSCISCISVYLCLSLSISVYLCLSLSISVYLCLSSELCFGLFRKGPWMALVPGPPYAVRSVRKRRPLLVSESKSVAAWKSCSVLAKAKANEVDCGLLTMLGKHYANTLPIKHRKRPVQVQQRPVQVQQTCQTSWTVR